MRNDPFSIFNVNEFKKWMESSNSTDNVESNKSMVGLNVTSKVSFKKLKSVSEALDNERAIMEFHKNGGTILEEEDKLLTIKTNKGSIKLHRSYTVVN